MTGVRQAHRAFAVLRSANARALGLSTSGYLVAALLLGGGTRAGFFGDVVLQVAAVFLLLLALWGAANRQEPSPISQARWQIAVVLVVVPTIALLQLLPLPWAWLPGGSRANGDPLSVSTNATWLAALSALPAIALFVAAVQLPRGERRRVVVAALGMGMVSVFVGLLQVAQGPQSSLRFYTFTNATEAVGFFANRNHFSALLYVLLVFATAWAVNAVGAFDIAPWRRKFDRPIILPLALSAAMVVVLVAAQSYARSRAGLGLTIIALLAGALLPLGGTHQAMRGSRKILFGATFLGVIIAAQFSLYRMLQRFESDPLDDARLPFAQNTFQAAKEYLPFGSGLGTFVPIYDATLRPADALLDRFANRAHNDFLEGWLELGFLGAALTGVFLLWLVMRAVHAWKRSELNALDALICRGATISILLLLAHSVVDYPLRTTALLCVFALCCALLVEPSPVASAEVEQHKRRQPTSKAPITRYPAHPAAPIARSVAQEWRAAESSPADVGAAPKKAENLFKAIGEWPSEWQRRRPAEPDTDK